MGQTLLKKLIQFQIAPDKFEIVPEIPNILGSGKLFLAPDEETLCSSHLLYRVGWGGGMTVCRRDSGCGGDWE